MTFLNITVGEKEFDEIKEGKVGLVCLPCTPTLVPYPYRGCKANNKIRPINGQIR